MPVTVSLDVPHLELLNHFVGQTRTSKSNIVALLLERAPRWLFTAPDDEPSTIWDDDTPGLPEGWAHYKEHTT